MESEQKNKRFLGDEAGTAPIKRVTIIPAPLAETVSWMRGTEMGPSAILDASPALEVFDDELLQETVDVGFVTESAIDFSGLDTEGALSEIYRKVALEISQGSFPVILGGEHTVTFPAVLACASKYPNLHVVQIDAHLDLREQYEHDIYSHACVMRRIADFDFTFSQVGIRSFSREEWEYVAFRKLNPFTMTRIRNNKDWITKVCKDIKGPVYLTFDVDGLDPSIMPATGTPEPDGLLWGETVSLIRNLAHKGIVGMDFVEFAPFRGGHHAAFTVAKLIYRTLGYIFQPFFKNHAKA